MTQLCLYWELVALWESAWEAKGSDLEARLSWEFVAIAQGVCEFSLQSSLNILLASCSESCCWLILCRCWVPVWRWWQQVTSWRPLATIRLLDPRRSSPSVPAIASTPWAGSPISAPAPISLHLYVRPSLSACLCRVYKTLNPKKPLNPKNPYTILSAYHTFFHGFLGFLVWGKNSVVVFWGYCHNYCSCWWYGLHHAI